MALSPPARGSLVGGGRLDTHEDVRVRPKRELHGHSSQPLSTGREREVIDRYIDDNLMIKHQRYHHRD